MDFLVKKLVLGELSSNCWLVANQKKECLIIDPGDVGIEEVVESEGWKPIIVAATHGHFDHVLGALDLKLMYGIPFACSSQDEFLLKRQGQTAKYFLGKEIKTPNFSKIDIDLDKEKEIFGLKVIKTPGHTPGSVCFYSKEDNLLFSGDTLFADGAGRTDFSYGDNTKLQESLKKLAKLPPKTLILPGHGDKKALG